MALKGFFLLSILLLGGLSGCMVVPTIAPPPPMKELKTFDANYQEGKSQFDRSNYDEAVRYLKEALRLEPNNQQAHALLAVAYTKLGQWAEALNEFETTVKLNKNSSEGKQAEEWLKRLGQPIPVLILPFQYSRAGNAKGKELVAKESYNTLNEFLKSSGLYQVLSVKKGSKLGELIRANLGGNLSPVCQEVQKNGIKIIISGVVTDVILRRDSEPLLYLGPSQNTKNFFTGSMKVSLNVYSTKDCRLVHTATGQESFEKIPNENLDAVFQKALNIMFQKMFKEINSRLI